MFAEKKIGQEICYLLSLNNNKMNLLKLIKELYLIDRESINDTNFSVSGDVFFSLPHGPVLSATLNLLYDLTNNNSWGKYIKSEPAKFYPNIVLYAKNETDELSEKEKEYINKISNQFKDFDSKQIEKYTHNNLKEWKNPVGSAIKIRFQDIMIALGKTDEEIIDAKKEYDNMSNLISIVG